MGGMAQTDKIKKLQLSNRRRSGVWWVRKRKREADRGKKGAENRKLSLA